MQLEISEDAHVHIVLGTTASVNDCSAVCACLSGALTGAPRDASTVRPAVRFGRLLLKGGMGAILLAGSFAIGHYLGSPSRAPEFARTTAALPRAAPTTEQHAFPDPPQPRDAPAQAAPQVPADFQRQLQRPPTVVPPPGQTAAPATPGKNPFGLEN